MRLDQPTVVSGISEYNNMNLHVSLTLSFQYISSMQVPPASINESGSDGATTLLPSGEVTLKVLGLQLQHCVAGGEQTSINWLNIKHINPCYRTVLSVKIATHLQSSSRTHIRPDQTGVDTVWDAHLRVARLHQHNLRKSRTKTSNLGHILPTRTN